MPQLLHHGPAKDGFMGGMNQDMNAYQAMEEFSLRHG
jgi:hypothetical protein